ncbi:MAG: hypothetical protein BWK73_50885 [Thiothrix lacustris]|uniref:Uncharacterized protein n=1 Tax=Thiothrix lacustris TaxID=525917 RepID=A0A1Y1Q8G9_9GAMM|nr:MAG: hypothetical protein BWK73_50885 [Thiothrix lacustris]
MTLQSKIDGMQWEYSLTPPSREWCCELENEVGRACAELADSIRTRALADFHRQQLDKATARHYLARMRDVLND